MLYRYKQTFGKIVQQETRQAITGILFCFVLFFSFCGTMGYAGNLFVLGDQSSSQKDSASTN